jgi:hypothetical protein
MGLWILDGVISIMSALIKMVYMRLFSWAEVLLGPIIKGIWSHIDRVFCNTDFDNICPLATSRALPKNPSDHVPILWEFGQAQKHRKPRFKFEKWWLLHDSIGELVQIFWQTPVGGRTTIERWQNKVKLFRKKTRGWSINIESENRKRMIN